MALLDSLTGGKNSAATDAQDRALQQLLAVQTPTQQQLTLPELQQYALAQNMTPAQMQAFLQQSNAFNAPVDQTGTAAQVAAINQLAQVANAGAAGSPTQQAQVEQINQDAARNLAGQRGAIDQQAAARGVPVGLLQAALQSQQAGQGLQDAHMAALQAQGQNYQQALAAMASGAGAGQALQGQQNTQANAIAQAQNAMQQFNAANQQNAAQTNAANQQQANLTNAAMANQVSSANTGLANQRTQYNTSVPQQVFENQLQKATGTANQENSLANTLTSQGQQNAGLFGGLLGAGATVIGGMYGGPAGAAAGKTAADAVTKAHGGIIEPTYAKGGVIQPYARGGPVVDPDDLLRRLAVLRGAGPQGPGDPMQNGPLPMRRGGMVPGEAKVPGDSLKNDTVLAKLSPGELVVPRTQVPQVATMMAQRQPPMMPPRQAPLMPPRPMPAPMLPRPMPAPMPPPAPGNHPQDVATLLAAMRHLRGAAA